MYRDQKLVAVFHLLVNDYSKLLDIVIDENRYGHPPGKATNRIAAFRPSWLIDFDVEKYLACVHSWLGVDDQGDEDIQHIVDKAKRISRDDTGRHFVLNRHAFANFGRILNFLADVNGFTPQRSGSAVTSDH